MPLNSVRNRLVLLFFAITTAAVGFVYLYVVPQLRSSLTAEKLTRLEATAAEQSERVARALERGASQSRLRRLAVDIAQETDARVTLLGLEEGEAGFAPAFVISDSELERTAVEPRYAAAANAADTGVPSSAVERVDGHEVGETAVAVGDEGRPRWAAVLSTSLDDVDDSVALIQRQILIAGGIALAAALLAGYFAARAHSRRLSRLEEAAEKIAGGNFTDPIPVDSSDEVGQLAMTFNEMQQRLGRLDGARKEFIANASHELRTPIFSLGGFVELLEHEEPDRASREEFVREMRRQIERLTKLTADLLDLSKLDADAIELQAEPVELKSLAELVAAEFRPAAERHSSKLDVADGTGPALARGDPDRVAQIIRILLDNALTHTREGTAISVTTMQGDGTAGLVVTDTGAGIDPRTRGRVFERFYTGDSVSGSGLGLAIARELAMRMDGSLRVASRRGHTGFTLELPGVAATAVRA
jgi:two-component system, OmpR family, sensor kinase